MLDFVRLPEKPSGEPEEALQKMYSYLYNMALTLNKDFEEIGGAELTDAEQGIMKEILKNPTWPEGDSHETETLKQMIVKTAAHIKTAIAQYNLKLTGSVKAEGTLGRYVRKTGLNVAVNPEGIMQKYTFEEVVQGLKTYEINAKNYIYSGLLRTVNGIPVYGVAVGKDIVTFSEDGTETYHDGAKVAEFTADELSFYQNEQKIASYTGTGITMYLGMNIISPLGIRMATGNTEEDTEIVLEPGILDDPENPPRIFMNTPGQVVLQGDSTSIIVLADEITEVFSVDAEHGIKAHKADIEAMHADAADVDSLNTGNLMINGSNMPSIIVSETDPRGTEPLSNVLWLEPQTGSGSGEAFSGTRKSKKAAAHACTQSGETFVYSVGLSANLDLTDVSTLSFSGKMTRNGADQVVFSVSAAVKCSDGSTISLGTVSPSGSRDFQDYTLSGSASSIPSGKTATGIEYTLSFAGTFDPLGHYSSFDTGTLSYSGTHSGSTPTEVCTVHYIPYYEPPTP